MTDSEVYSIATALLKKYSTRHGINRHMDELVAEYGKDDYFRISIAAKEIRDTTGLGKRFDYNSPEKKKKRQLAQRMNSRYAAGKRYVFTALGRLNDIGMQLLVDQFGDYQPVRTSVSYDPGDRVSCKVVGIYSKIKPSGEVIVNLRLVEPRRLKPLLETDSDQPIIYVKRPEQWYREVIDLGKHKCGKPFTCSCCGGHFPAYAGVRVDLKEIYFCNSCASQIYEPKKRGHHRFFISTPMGNKR
ncbi:MAG: hypothetical protein J6Y45_06260 [Bacteroidales bacterium]|nr:hypothetical protein [Bacteroidales bacterium]